MNLGKAGVFFHSHNPVQFPADELTLDYRPAVAAARAFARTAGEVINTTIRNKGFIENAINEALETAPAHDPFTRILARALFLANAIDWHHGIFRDENQRGAHRLTILLQRELVNMLLYLHPERHAEIIDADWLLKSRTWCLNCAGARAVVSVINHLLRPNRMFFFPSVDEDQCDKIDLIVLDADGHGICCQVKGTKDLDGIMRIECLTEPPEDPYLLQFYRGTVGFNTRNNLACAPVVFIVGW